MVVYVGNMFFQPPYSRLVKYDSSPRILSRHPDLFRETTQNPEEMHWPKIGWGFVGYCHHGTPVPIDTPIRHQSSQ